MNSKINPARQRPPGAQRQRDARTRLHLTLQDVADWCHVSKESVRLWEAGRAVKPRNAVSLSKLLDLTVDELLEGRIPHVVPIGAEILDEMSEVLGTMKLLVKQIGQLAAHVERVQRYD